MTHSDHLSPVFGLATAILAAIVSLSTFASQTAHAQTFTLLHQFTGGVDGANPAAGLTLDRSGKLYGTSSGSVQGTIGTGFQMAESGSNWPLNPIFQFVQFNRGLYANSRLIFGPDGSLYGTTWKGGVAGCGGQGCGVIFKLQPPKTIACRTLYCPWTETVLYTFTSAEDGWNPGPVVFDAAGNIYGTTYYGGTEACQCGTVYQLKLSGGVWSKTTLHSFAGADGASPDGPLVLDQAGNLYGTAVSGGAGDKGIVYQLSPSGQSWTETVLYTFQVSDGAYPNGGLIADASGNLYGVTAEGGPIGLGTVFRLTQPGKWNLETLYSFKSYATGGSPHGPLAFDSAGNLYGLADFGYFMGGMVFELAFANQSWTVLDLHDFKGSDGTYINPGLVVDAKGNVYGTAFGDSQIDACYPVGCGNVWQITPQE